MLAPSGFGLSSRTSKNDFVRRDKNFVAAARVKSVHNAASGIEKNRGWTSSCVSIADAFCSGHCAAGERLEGRDAPDRGLSSASPQQLSTRQKQVLAVVSETTLSEGESEQARAQKREASRRQRQEAVGDKVMIAHDATSESMLAGIH